MEETQTVTLFDDRVGLAASFAPTAGMVCWSLRSDGVELLAQRDGVAAYSERGATMGIPLLYPWANRLAAFDYEVAGKVVELPHDQRLIATDANGLPIHGVIPSHMTWRPDEERAGSDRSRLVARLAWDQPALRRVFPFAHEVALEANLRAGALELRTTVTANGAAEVPVSFGFHPYLQLPGSDRSTWAIEMPAAARLELDERMIPTGRSDAVAGERFVLGDRAFDDAFAVAQAPVRFSVTGAERRLAVEFIDGYDYAQVFSPPGAQFICFEPMTAPANALRSGQGLRVLAPGERFSAAFRVAVEHV